MVAWDLKIAGKPPLDATSVVDCSVQVPYVPGLIFVDTDEERKDLTSHELQFRLVSVIL